MIIDLLKVLCACSWTIVVTIVTQKIFMQKINSFVIKFFKRNFVFFLSSNYYPNNSKIIIYYYIIFDYNKKIIIKCIIKTKLIILLNFFFIYLLARSFKCISNVEIFEENQNSINYIKI